MPPIYLSVTHVREFGVATLADHMLCRLREASEQSAYPEALARSLSNVSNEVALRAEVSLFAETAAVSEPLPALLTETTQFYGSGALDDGALLRAWESEILRRIGDAPYQLGSPTRQLPYPAVPAVMLYALVIGARRQLAGKSAIPALIAAPFAPESAPTFGGRGPEVFIAGDPEDRALPEMLETAAGIVERETGGARWVWLHAPRIETPQAVARCLQRANLLRGKQTADIRMIAGMLRVQGTPYAPALSKYSDPQAAQRMLPDLRMLDACGVPRSRRPALIVERALYLGSDQEWQAAMARDMAALQLR